MRYPGGFVFDLGGTFLRSGVSGHDGVICSRSKTRILSVADEAPVEEIWNQILTLVLDYESQHRGELEWDAPVVLAFPGPIRSDGITLQAPTVVGRCSGQFELPGAIQRATGRTVLVLNDVSAAAWKIAETATVERFAVVTVSSGIGSKIFDKHHPRGVLDRPAYAGEIAHVVVDDRLDAPVCDCGGKGHLGAIASGRGIERIIRQRAREDAEAFSRCAMVTRFGASVKELNNEQHIVPAVLAGDVWTSSSVCECTRFLVRSLLTVIMTSGLERVFFIGGFANALGGRYIEIVRDLAHELSQYDVVSPYLSRMFESGPLDQETCLEGCAAFLRAQVVCR